jgi:RNA polymerase sigma-70 factor, ECF subfamily
MRLVATYPPLSTAAMAQEETDSERLVLQLFHLHGDAIFRFAMLMLGRRHDAEDVVQDTFLRLMRHVTAARPLPNARGWIYTVAAHACRDRQRAARRWIAWSPERDLRTSSAQPDAVDNEAPVRTALRRLSTRDRLLVTLRAEGLSYSEIAEAAGLRGTSVGRILARAVARLARELEASGVRT